MRQRPGRRRGGLRAGLAACLGVLALAAIAAAYAHDPGVPGRPGSVEPPPLPTATSALPESSRSPTSTAAEPNFRFGTATASWFAAVVRPVVAREAPSVNARVVGRLSTTTPEGTTNVVPLLRRVERTNALWIQVGVPALPNGSTGWVPRTTLGGYQVVHTRLVVSLRTFKMTLYRGNKPIFSAPIGVGQSRWPTPTGRFLIRNKLTKYASPAYGPVAFGTSARSAVLTDWPAGGFVGIHGTNRPDLIPGQISHGCIRLRNADILRLEQLLPLGTPVLIS